MKRKDFPILRKIVYLDNASGSLKPKQVVNSIVNFYLNFSINPHNIESSTGIFVDQKIKDTKTKIANLINAHVDQIIFTSGTTDSLNKASQMIKPLLNKNDQILIWNYNHMSNVAPWVQIAKELKLKVIFSNDIYKDINENTKLICYSQVTNNLNVKIDYKKIYRKAKKVGAWVINDAAQAIADQKVDSNFSDMIAFSANKIFGPTGIGILQVNKGLLKHLNPKTFGGGTVFEIKDNLDFLYFDKNKFEPGTLNTAGIFGFNAAIDYFENNFNKIKIVKKNVSEYAFDQLKKLKNIEIYSKKGDSIILFNFKKIHAQDVVSFLGNKNIILRSGSHCSPFLSKNINCQSSIRLSIGPYNNKKDINKLYKTLNKEINKGGYFV